PTRSATTRPRSRRRSAGWSSVCWTRGGAGARRSRSPSGSWPTPRRRLSSLRPSRPRWWWSVAAAAAARPASRWDPSPGSSFITPTARWRWSVAASNQGGTPMDRNYLVVVGVDGSDSSLRALQWAAHEAAQRGGTVQAITAWRWDVPGGGIANEGPADMEARDRAAQILEQAVAALTGDTPVATEVVEGRPADV